MIKVLDHGFVRLVDKMGDDARICEAARRSVQKEGAKRRPDKDLIDYLVRNGHLSPLEHVKFTFEVKCPIFVARQVLRYRTANVSELSGRYSEMPDEFYLPELERIAGDNYTLQHDGAPIRNGLKFNNLHTFSEYRYNIAVGVEREVARINLPLSTYTNFYWTIDLRNLLNFLRQRLDKHAQWEVQEYARALLSIIEQELPETVKAWQEHINQAVTISANHWNILKQFLRPILDDSLLFDDARNKKLFFDKLSELGVDYATS